MDIREIEYKAEEMRIVNLAVMKDGQVILKRDWDVEMRRNQYSASKSFTSAAVGIAEREGLLGLEEKLCDVFREEVPENPSEGHGAGFAYHVPRTGRRLSHGGTASVYGGKGLGALQSVPAFYTGAGDLFPV